MPPSSWQCWYGGAGEGAEETSGGEVSEGPLRGDRCPLRRQGTTKKHFPVRDISVQTFFCFVLFSYIVFFFLSLLGHTTTEQTQSDLWDNNQVRNNSFWKGDKWQWHWLKWTMMMRTLFSSLTDPRPAHLELFRQVTAKARVDLSPSTRWSSLIFAFTRPERPQRSYRAV